MRKARLVLLPAVIVGMRYCAAFTTPGKPVLNLPKMFLSSHSPISSRLSLQGRKFGPSPWRWVSSSTHHRQRFFSSFPGRANTAILIGTAVAGLATWVHLPGTIRTAHAQSGSCEQDSEENKQTGVGGHRIGHVNVLPGMITTEHFFHLPKDYKDPSAGTIEVFCREIVATKNMNKNLPYLVYLQGGPGFAGTYIDECDSAGRPVSADGGWMKRALQQYRIILLDQRGTGRSTAVTHETLQALKGGVDAQVRELCLMRADNIVRDCESIRHTLIGNAKWSILGQSFGGFCALTYLSLAPDGLEEAFITGGLAPVYAGSSADEVYKHTYERMASRSNKFYDRYAQHEHTVRHILEHLERNKVTLPGGGVLTPRRFLQLGLCLGSGSGLETLHYLLEHPWTPTGQLSYDFLCKVEAQTSFETNPLYALMHEAIYCSGQGAASKWSAQRMMPDRFDYRKALKDNNRVYFFGEHCFQWMFDGDYEALGGLKDAAEVIANKKNWSDLYDEQALKACEVPTAAVVYYDDVYVERTLSEATARLVGSGPVTNESRLSGGVPMKIWVTNEYQHSGVRDDGYHILDRLIGMVNGVVNIPS